MSQYILRHDEANCIACKACEVHCKTNKQLGPGPAPAKSSPSVPTKSADSRACVSFSCPVSTARNRGA